MAVSRPDDSAGEEPIEEHVANGNYTIVSVEADASGNRATDEIFYLAAVADGATYSQYIMPYVDLTLATSRRSQVSVLRSNGFRSLRCLRTNQYLDTKSEFVATAEFLEWLEGLKSKSTTCDGIIVSHYNRSTPKLILSAMKKYGLLTDFCVVVKSFVNIRDVVPESKHIRSFNSFRATFLHETDVNQNTDVSANAGEYSSVSANLIPTIDVELDAKARAQTIYEVYVKLSTAQSQSVQSFIRPYVQPIAREVETMKHELRNAECNQSLCPIFNLNLKANTASKNCAGKFRSWLVEQGFDKQKLSGIWNEQSVHGFEDMLKDYPTPSQTEMDELVALLESYFQPKKNSEEPPETIKATAKNIQLQMYNSQESLANGKPRRQRRRPKNKQKTNQPSQRHGQQCNSEKSTSKSVQNKS